MTKKNNGVRRSMARGASARGTSGINENGADAYNQSRKSTKGHYRVTFTKTYQDMTDKDVELRHTYGKDLVASSLGVPADMVILRAKKKIPSQTLTSMDEVFYIKVGSITAGKLSIRTQRLRKTTMLMFIFQQKHTALKPPQKAFSRKVGFKNKTSSQKSQTKRNSYNSRRGGKN